MSEQFLATASVRIVPDVTGFAAALQAEVTAATRAVRVPAVSSAIAANTVATRTFTAATGTSTIAVKAATDALVLEGAAEGKSAAAKAINTKEARASAVAHDQMARGIGTATASQFGLRGAVLASSGPFLAAVVGVETLRKTIDAFSQEQESAARVTAILGTELGRSSEEWAKQQAAIGLSAEAALKYQGAIAQVFRNVKIASDENAKFSQNLVTRAVDVAARSNVPVTSVLRAFQLALSGNLRGLRQYVPAVDAATIANRALADTGKKVKAELSTQELVLARYEVLMARSANQAGTFAERSGDLAAQTKIAQSELANLGASIGSLVIPVLTPAVRLVGALAENLHKLAEASKPSEQGTQHQSTATKVLNAVIHESGREYGVLAALIARTDKAVTQWGEVFGIAAQKTDTANSSLVTIQQAIDDLNATTAGSVGGFDAMGRALNLVTGELQNAKAAVNDLKGALADLNAASITALRGVATGVSDQVQLANAKAVLAAATAARQAADALPPTTGKATEQKQRLEAEAAARAQVDAIQGRLDAAAQSAANKAKSAANAAKAAAEEAARAAEAARRAHDQDIQNANDSLQFTIDLAQLKAQRTKSLQDDLAADRLELVIINEKVANASKILDATQREQTLEALTLDAERARQAIAETRAQIAANIRQRKVDAAEAKVTIAGLDADLAATLGHPKDRIAALRRQNAALEEEKKLWQGNGVKLREIRNQIAENNKTIKDIQGEQQKGISAALQFEFLQTQQGFAANLLGNLIPTGSTAGLVGGPTSGAISTATSVPGPAGFATAAHGRPGHDLTTATQTAGLRGASAGQMSTLIHINSQMLAAMLRLAGRSAAPEAGRQHGWQSTPLTDTFGW